MKPTSPLPVMALLALASYLTACAGETPARAPAAEPAEPPTAAPSEPPPAEWLTDITRQAGIDFVHAHGGSGERYMVETMGGGGGFFDFDNDGWLDIYLVQGGPLAATGEPSASGDRLYANRGQPSGTVPSFSDRSAAAAAAPGYGMGACFADVDNDGFTDVYLTRFGADRLLRNDGGQRLVDVTEAAGIANPHWAASCAFADYDRDGCLDLYVVNYVDFSLDTHRPCVEDGLHVYCHPDVYDGVPDVLYRNRCGGAAGRFEDVSRRAGVRNDDPGESKGLGVVWTDFDDDGDVDLYVANDSTRNFLYRNEGPGAGGEVGFRDVGVSVGAAFNDRGLTEAGMGTDAGDVDGDGRFDLFVAHLDFETNTLYHNQGRGLFLDATARSGLAAPSLRRVGFGVNLFDVDNDSHLDLFVANGHILDNISEQHPGLTYAQPDQLFRGDGSGTFELAGETAGAYFAQAFVGRGTAAGDIDNDGDLDLLVINNDQPPVLLHNRIGDRSQALILHLESRYGGRHAIGAKATLVTARRTQVEEVRSGSSYLSQGDLRLHFGLGQGQGIERLEIRWPEGEIESIEVESLAINAVNRIRQQKR